MESSWIFRSVGASGRSPTPSQTFWADVTFLFVQRAWRCCCSDARAPSSFLFSSVAHFNLTMTTVFLSRQQKLAQAMSTDRQAPPHTLFIYTDAVLCCAVRKKELPQIVCAVPCFLLLLFFFLHGGGTVRSPIEAILGGDVFSHRRVIRNRVVASSRGRRV